MAALNQRVKALEDRHGTARKQPRHFIMASAGGQSKEEVWDEARRVCAGLGMPITDEDDFCLILRPMHELGKDGRPVYADMPISINRVNGRWLR